MTMRDLRVPDGFAPLQMPGAFTDLVGPYFIRYLPDGAFRYGFLTDQRHSNTNGVIHGAAYMGFVDTIMGHAVREQLGRNCATISLHSHFLTSTKPGGWLEADVTITRATRSMVYIQAEIFSDGTALHSASGVFKLFGDLPKA